MTNMPSNCIFRDQSYAISNGQLGGHSMKIGFGAALVALSAAPAALGAPPAAPPYALRGIALGTSLGEFQATPVPLEPGFSSPVVICSGPGGRYDPDVRLSEDEEGVGMIRCGWKAVRDSTRDAIPSPQPLFVPLGLGGGYVAFDFIPDTSGTPRLFRIKVDANMQYSDGLVASYVQKFGPGKNTRGVVPNELGGSFPKSTYRWSNGSSSIELEERCGQVNFLCVRYSHAALNKLYEQKLGPSIDAKAAKL
jgi:hypothetical protein